MHKKDFSTIIDFFKNLIWLVRAILVLFLLPIFLIVLFPVQISKWIFGRNSFFKTNPYFLLFYNWEKYSDFYPKTFSSFEEWTKKKER